MDSNEWKGHLILIVAPPGGGKSTLISHIRETNQDVVFAVSGTSRPIRPGEVDGENYYFLTEEEFQSKIKNGEFLEWIQQDGGRYYGTLKSEIVDKVKAGGVVIREVEVRGAETIQTLIPKKNLSIIFITAGSWKEMVGRIQKRAPMSPEELEFRRHRYEKELLFADKADYIVTNRNGELADAKEQLRKIISDIVANVREKNTHEF